MSIDLGEMVLHTALIVQTPQDLCNPFPAHLGRAEGSLVGALTTSLAYAQETHNLLPDRCA